jgi:hypothetical protein
MREFQRFRRDFYREVLHGLWFTCPVLTGLLGFMTVLGLLLSYLQGWKALDGVYFAFVTGLTVGYGDLVPTTMLSRVTVLVIGFAGILVTGLIAATVSTRCRDPVRWCAPRRTQIVARLPVRCCAMLGTSRVPPATSASTRTMLGKNVGDNWAEAGSRR